MRPFLPQGRPFAGNPKTDQAPRRGSPEDSNRIETETARRVPAPRVEYPCWRQNEAVLRRAEGKTRCCQPRLVLRHLVIDLVSPGVDAAFDALQIFEALLP